MKVYCVTPEDYDYDEYDGFVVVAENTDRAIEIVKNKFRERQGKIRAEEIDLTFEHVALGSYIGG